MELEAGRLLIGTDVPESEADMHQLLVGIKEGLAIGPLLRFMAKAEIEAAVAKEREECAKTVEAEAQRNVTKYGPEYEKAAKAESWAMLQAAHAIRNRSRNR